MNSLTNENFVFCFDPSSGARQLRRAFAFRFGSNLGRGARTSCKTVARSANFEFDERGKNILTLDADRPHLVVLLRNVSNQPIRVPEEWNSWGFFNLHLEVMAIDGIALAEPLIISKQGTEMSSRRWYENYFTTETLAPNQSIAREVYLHVPAEVKNPNTSPTKAEIDRDRSPREGYYLFFPFRKNWKPKNVTVKAIFEVRDFGNPKNPLGLTAEEMRGVWTGRVESPLLSYDIVGGAPRR